jgi:hypothetical protein
VNVRGQIAAANRVVRCAAERLRLRLTDVVLADLSGGTTDLAALAACGSRRSAFLPALLALPMFRALRFCLKRGVRHRDRQQPAQHTAQTAASHDGAESCNLIKLLGFQVCLLISFYLGSVVVPSWH